MSRHHDETVIQAHITYDRITQTVTVHQVNGHTSSHSAAAERLRSAIAGLELAQRAAARSLIVAECAMNNVAGQYGIRHNVRSITQP